MSNPATTPAEPLALDGGTPVIAKEQAPQPPLRWGTPELEELRTMLEHRSLFYWKHPAVEKLT